MSFKARLFPWREWRGGCVVPRGKRDATTIVANAFLMLLIWRGSLLILLVSHQLASVEIPAHSLILYGPRADHSCELVAWLMRSMRH